MHGGQMEKISVYLDTCIISGIARMDLKDDDIEALLTIFEQSKKGNLNIITSQISKSELDAIPVEFRKKHELIYYLLADSPYVQNARMVWQSGMNLGIGIGLGFGHRRRSADPLFSKLSSILPDANDAMHVFQATKNQIQYFLTVDQKTILKFKAEIGQICNLKAVSPIELKHEITQLMQSKTNENAQGVNS
jgi:hypothetical protein